MPRPWTCLPLVISIFFWCGQLWFGARAATASPAAGATSDERVVAVHIVSRVNQPDAIADDRPKRARVDIGVTLHAVIETERAGTRRFYSEAGRIRLGRRIHTTLPMARAPRALLRWYRVEPTLENMSNTASGRFRFEPIPYGETPIAPWQQRATAAADVRPTLTPDRGGGAGTMRFKLEARTDDGVFATAGAEAHRGSGAGGLRDHVHRVSLRRDDGYLGQLTELYGQPYIWASGGTSDRAHQSERLEGADCADFVVYGMRRLGHAIPYTWTEGLRDHTRNLGSGSPRADGVYVDAGGRPLPFPAPGDLVLFPRHVGALVADRGVPGVLDAADIMAHTLFASPREQPIGDTSYAGLPIELLRWRTPARAQAREPAPSPAATRSAR